MHGLCCIVVLNDNIGFGKTSVEVALFVLEMSRNVARLIRLFPHLIGSHVLVQKRCIFLHCIEHLHHRRQHLILNINEFKCLFSCMGVNRCNRCDLMPFVESLLASQYVILEVFYVGCALSKIGDLIFDSRKIFCCDNCPHAGMSFCATRINRLNPRMRVGATQDFAV